MKSHRITLPLVAVACALGAGGADCPLAEHDGGWEGDAQGLMVRPFLVVAEESVDAAALFAACERWNEGAIIPAWDCAVDTSAWAALEQGVAETDLEYDLRRAGTARVWVEGLPPGSCGDEVEDPDGCVEVHVSAASHETVWCDIRIDPTVAYDAPTVEVVVVHELGQCAGLAHDRQLDSCLCADPQPVPCVIQDADLDRVQQGRDP